MFRLILNTFLNHIFTPRHEMRNGIVLFLFIIIFVFISLVPVMPWCISSTSTYFCKLSDVVVVQFAGKLPIACFMFLCQFDIVKSILCLSSFVVFSSM